MLKSMSAKFSSRCARTSEPIQVGDLIEYNTRTRSAIKIKLPPVFIKAQTMNNVQQELIELHRLGVASLEAVKAAAGDLREFDNMTTTEVASLLMELYPCAS